MGSIKRSFFILDKIRVKVRVYEGRFLILKCKKDRGK